MRFWKGAIIFVLAFAAYLTFAPQDLYNPQQITRVALALSLSEGRVDIDRFADDTVDKALYDGHYYADKPPGLSMLAVPAVIAVREVLRGSGQPTDGQDEAGFYLYEKAAIVSTVGLLAAVAAAALYRLALRLGASEAGSVFAACALALGTPYFGWATAMFAHVPAGALLMLALTMTLGDDPPWRAALAFVLGLLFGLTLVIDLVAAPAALVIGCVALVRGGGGRWRRAAALLAGAAVGVLPLLVYNWAAFGSPFRLGYSQVVGFEGMKEGVFGISLPNPLVLVELLFGRYRGLLPLAPVLLLVPPGLFAMWRRGLRAAVLAIVGIGAFYLLINASYHYWDGGSSTGPRHVVAMLPALSLALAFAWPAWRPGQVVALVLLAASLVLSVICTSTLMFAGANYPDPLAELLLPEFLTPTGLLNAFRVAPIWVGFAILAVLGGRLRPERNELTA